MTLLRLMPAEVTMRDAHTLTGRLVPYDTPAPVVDLLADGSIDKYREGFRTTAFENAFAGPHRVRLVDGHRINGDRGPDLAVATSLRHAADGSGLEGEFRMLTESDAERVANLLDVGVTGLSVGFAPARGGTHTDADGVRWRTRALLDHVSLEAVGAYAGAEVLAFRTDEPDELAIAEAEYEAMVADIDERLAKARAAQNEWMERLGIRAE